MRTSPDVVHKFLTRSKLKKCKQFKNPTNFLVVYMTNDLLPFAGNQNGMHAQLSLFLACACYNFSFHLLRRLHLLVQCSQVPKASFLCVFWPERRSATRPLGNGNRKETTRDLARFSSCFFPLTSNPFLRKGYSTNLS